MTDEKLKQFFVTRERQDIFFDAILFLQFNVSKQQTFNTSYRDFNSQWLAIYHKKSCYLENQTLLLYRRSVTTIKLPGLVVHIQTHSQLAHSWNKFTAFELRAF